MKARYKFFALICCVITALSMRSAPVWASSQELSILDDPALNPRTNLGHQPTYQKSINDILDSYTLKEIFSYPGIDRKVSGVCHLWEKLLMEQGTMAVIHFSNIDDLLRYPLSKYPKAQFRISCDLTPQQLAQFVQRIPIIRDLDLHCNKSIIDVSALGQTHILDLNRTKIRNVSALGRVHTLNLSWTKVSDVSALGWVHTLDLSYTNVSDVSILRHVHTLDLSYTNVSDVLALGQVHTLNLSWTKVSDVSALGRVHTLDLSHTKVSDVSALGQVHTLDLTYTKVTDFSALDHVPHLISSNHYPIALYLK